MAEASPDGRTAVSERLGDLVEALLATPTLNRYRVALERFRTDGEILRLQAALRATHERFREAQQAKRHDPQLFKEMRELQAQLQEHPVVLEFVAARDGAEDLLRMTNQEMTAILGIDLAASLPRTGCCS